MPLACFVLAMVGIPLGVTTRKGGKSAAYVNAIFLAFFCYYMSFVSLVNLAKQRTLPAQVALWIPNEVLGLVGLIFLLAAWNCPATAISSATQGWLRARCGAR